MAFPQSALLAKAEFAFNADLTADPGTWSFTDVTSKLRTEDTVTVTFGKANETSTADPSTCACAFNDTDGALTPRNPSSTTPLQRGTPFRFSVHDGSGYVERFTGFTSEVKPKWLDMGRRVPTIAFQAAGIMRRLTQGATPLKSPIYRCTTSNAVTNTVTNRIAYWPIEDEANASSIAAAAGLSGVAAMTFAGGTISFANYDKIPGSAKLATLGDGTQLDVGVPSYTSDEHKITSLWNVPTGALGAGSVMEEIYVGGGTGINLVKLIWQGGNLEVAAFNGKGTQIASSGSVSFGATEDQGFMTSVELTKVSADIKMRLFVIPINPNVASNGALFDTTVSAVSLNKVTHITIAPAGFMKDVSVGHVTVLKDTSALGNADGINGAIFGYLNEEAGDRIARLCTEEGIPCTVDSGVTEPMGPQSVNTFVELLRQCEAADHGTLFEESFGFRYIPRLDRQNAATAFTLDGSGGYLAADPQPVEDDDGIANDVTATRPGGSSARYENDAAITADGRYNKSADVNVPDARLLHHAEWISHLGSRQDMRVPQLVVDFANPTTHGLFDDYLAAGIGSRVMVSNLPATRMPNGIDVFIEGAQEVYGPYEATVTLNCSPARPHEAVIVADTQFGRLDTAGSQLASSATSSATSLSVSTTTGPIWTRTATRPGDFPFDIEVINSGALAGERMTVSAIVNSSSPQTFTVTRGVNGVSVAHAAGATVKLWRPGQISL